MKLKYVLWDGVSGIILPNGQAYTADSPDFAAMVGQPPQAKLMLGQAGNITYTADNLDLMRATYDIADELPDAQALADIAEMRNAPPPPPEPTAEERIAAALEFQNAAKLAEEGYAVAPEIAEKNYRRGLWSEGMVAKALGPEAVSLGILTNKQLAAVRRS